MPKVAEVKTKEVKDTVKKATKPAGLTVPMFGLDGKEAGTLELSKEVFGTKVNQPLLAQAIRVYLNNLKSHWSDTKTRSEVSFSTRKVRTQKGTGGARHGSVRAPIFVHGGIALGPKFRKVVLDLPKKMKRAALLSALSLKASNGEVVAVSGLDKISGKTAEMKKLMTALNKDNALLVLEGKNEKVSRAVKNLTEVEVLPFDQLNTLNVIEHKTLLLSKEAAAKLEAKMIGEEKK